MKTELQITFLILAFAGMISSCIFDPQPEPDPGSAQDKDDEKQGDFESDSEDDDPSASEDSSLDGDDNSDGEGGNGDGDAGSYETDGTPIETLVFCSAPGANGYVAIVGVPGAASTFGETVTVRGSSNQMVELDVGPNGSFAGRIPAEDGEILTVTAKGEQGEGASIQVVAGERPQDNLSAAILGVEGTVIGPDMDQVVEIVGDGPTLQSGIMVIGGNVTKSQGRSTLVSCVERCRFRLYIEASLGDEIDLFIVKTGSQTGLSDYQTVVVTN